MSMSNVYTCPCPCPVENQKDQAVDIYDKIFIASAPKQTYSPGDIVESPTKAFRYEVVSFPFSLLYRDFKGEFEKAKWQPLVFEIQDMDLSESDKDLLIRFFGKHKTGAFVYVPSYERIFYMMVFLCLS